MSTEAVVFNGSTPVVIHHAGAVFLGSDTVGPVIFIGKTASGPTEHGNMKSAESVKHVISVTLGIGNGRILTYPDTTVYTCAEVFGKLSVDFLGNVRSLVGRLQLHTDCFGSHRNRSETYRTGKKNVSKSHV